MAINEDLFNPLKVCGFLMVGAAIFGFIFHFDSLKEPSFRWFIIIVTVWHLFTGIGILSRRIWGFYLLKLYLFILLLGFPIGTWLAFRGLKYIKEKEIIQVFTNKSIKR